MRSDNAYLSTLTEEKNNKYATKRNKTSETCEEIHGLRWGNKALMLAIFYSWFYCVDIHMQQRYY